MRFCLALLRRLAALSPSAIVVDLRQGRRAATRRGRIDPEIWSQERMRDVGLRDGRPARKGRADWE